MASAICVFCVISGTFKIITVKWSDEDQRIIWGMGHL